MPRLPQEPLPLELLALSLHHVQSREDHQVWLKLLQARHKHLQHIRSVGEVVGEDEPVGMGAFNWSHSSPRKADQHNGKKKEEALSLRAVWGSRGLTGALARGRWASGLSEPQAVTA